ncbi:MAG: Glu-tRNA(Gln) amidotransferase subunit GatE [Halobacteriota archaeon]|nr:Glu-tRNA(Gln) amidotransferase subunit GatE [Halobacteriota archaeon]
MINRSMKLDYKELGLKAGLEIHQQLDTENKLFCRCPTLLRDLSESDNEFFRYLRPTQSEMGETDVAALEEFKFNRKYIYKAYDTTCLVENDEEPPRELNEEALEISLEIGSLLNMTIVDEVHTMRKIVIDGSNTAGFQRTALVASNGQIDVDDKAISVTVLCLEEEASQKVSESKDGITYSLDRLGIPLVEIATGSDIKTPEQAKKVAEYLGMILRSTGKVKRGIGTIRQDINISIAAGARVEVKGVQMLGMIDKIVENEAIRQVALLQIREELKNKEAFVSEDIIDVSDIFKDTECKLIEKASRRGVVMGICLRGFGGLVGREIQPERRLGSEFSDRAKGFTGGIFHTDEMPKYGISDEEVRELKKLFEAGEEDCIIFVADRKDRVQKALDAVIERAKESMEKIPKETRRSLDNGSSAYMRPLPGSARMYPETDVPPVLIEADRIDRIELPELFYDRKERYKKEYALNEELATQISSSPDFELFEEIMKFDFPATLVVKTLVNTIPELQREGHQVENISEDSIIEIFRLTSEEKMAKEAINDVLVGITNSPDREVEDLIGELGFGAVDADQIEEILIKTVQERSDFIMERGLDSIGPLMGVVMKELRGKAKGEVVNKILKEKILEMVSDK